MVPVDPSTQELIYSGMICHVVINFNAYATALEGGGMARGVGTYVSHVMKVADGDRLDGRVAADTAFGMAIAELGDELPDGDPTTLGDAEDENVVF